MTLVERYLNEVCRRLPKTKRDDIRNELSSALADALEARAEGEPSDNDMVAVLKEFGSPEAVAASYAGDRYLIGPKLYPQFVRTVRIVVTVLASLIVLTFAISIVGGSSGLGGLTSGLGDLSNELLDSVLTAIGIVVIVFAVLERLDVGDSLRVAPWDPRKLPAVRDADVVGRFDSIAGIVFPAIILTLFNQFRDRIGILVHAGGERFAAGIVSDPGGELLLNDVFVDNLPWINASLLLPMVLSVWLFWSGRWHWQSRLLKIGFDLFALFVVHRICQGVIAARGELLQAGLPERLVAVAVEAAGFLPIVLALIIVSYSLAHLYRAYKSLA